MKQAARPKTREQVRAEFEHRGVSLAGWARQHKVSASLVYEILRNPKRRCMRGQSHRVAVLLGLKQGVIEAPATPAARTPRAAHSPATTTPTTAKELA